MNSRALFTKGSRLYLITDRSVSGLRHIEIAKRAIHAGVRIIQLREKEMSKKELCKEALIIRNLTLKYRATFIMNDYIDIALVTNADGVHLGQDDMPVKEARKVIGKDKIIGVSTHTLRQAIDAQNSGADYIGFGPIFKTKTKDAGKPKGIKALIEIKRHIKIPVVAIGGITSENAPAVLNAGADAVAVISDILKGDIETNIKNFMTLTPRISSPYE